MRVFAVCVLLFLESINSSNYVCMCVCPSGYGYADVATTIPFGAAGTVKTKNLAVYYRKTFSFTRVGTQTYTGVLSMQAVDGCVVYANGVEVGRYNMPTGTIGFSTLASASMSGVAGLTFQTITIPDALVLQGSNVIAVEVCTPLL